LKKQKIVLKTYIGFLSAVKEFTSVQGMEGDMDIFLTVEETKIWTKTNYLFSFRHERIYKIPKEWEAAWKFI